VRNVPARAKGKDIVVGRARIWRGVSMLPGRTQARWEDSLLLRASSSDCWVHSSRTEDAPASSGQQGKLFDHDRAERDIKLLCQPRVVLQEVSPFAPFTARRLTLEPWARCCKKHSASHRIGVTNSGYEQVQEIACDLRVGKAVVQVPDLDEDSVLHIVLRSITSDHDVNGEITEKIGADPRYWVPWEQSP